MSEYSPTSPYYNTLVTTGNYLDVMDNRSISKLETDVYWEVTSKYNHRPDLLAFDIYGDSKLWWVFASRNPNKLMDPVFDLISGVKIYIPKLDTLKLELGI